MEHSWRDGENYLPGDSRPSCKELLQDRDKHINMLIDKYEIAEKERLERGYEVFTQFMLNSQLREDNRINQELLDECREYLILLNKRPERANVTRLIERLKPKDETTNKV